MKIVLIVFHLFMVLMYAALGVLLLFTPFYSQFLTGTIRWVFGSALIAYASYRGWNVFRNILRQQK